MGNYTPLRRMDPLLALTLNQRFDELSEGIDAALPAVDEVTYTPAVSGHWLPTAPDNVDTALGTLMARLQYLPTRGLVSGLWIHADSVSNTVSIGRGVCTSDDGTETIINSTLATIIDITAEGINGKDVGVVAADTWYTVWLCKGTSGVGAVYSAASLAGQVVRPAGYADALRKIGRIRTDGSGAVRSQYMAPDRGNLRRVLYTEVGNAAPYLILDTANIGTSGAPTAVDLTAIVPSSAVAVIASILIATPSGACNIFWSAGDLPAALILTLPATSIAFHNYLDLPVYGTQAGSIYASAAVTEDLSLFVNGYIDSTLQEVS
jgi:hypothetical protein